MSPTLKLFTLTLLLRNGLAGINMLSEGSLEYMTLVG